MCSASGRATPGLFTQLADNAARSIAFQHAQTLGSIRQVQNFGAHAVHRRGATPGRFTLTTFLCTLQLPISARVPYTTAATLDTGRVASAYPGGSHTRLSSSHFQSARAFFGYAAPSSISSGA